MSQQKSTKKSKSTSKNLKPATARNKSSKVVSKISNTSAAARSIGQAVGTAFGGPMVGNLAGDATAWLSKIMGYGTYKVNRNTLLNNNQIPTFSTKGDTTVICNREYISDVISSTGFTNTAYLVNPGNATLFPWLSKVAEHYEEFKFHGLIMEFKSTSGTAISSTNTAMGTVVMAADYDALDLPYTSKRLMENTEYCTTDAPYNSFLHPIECAPGSSVFNKTFITSATSISNVQGDPRLYFPCNFQLATTGMQAVSNIGELWVSYQVELSKPSLENIITGIDTFKARFDVLGGVVSHVSTANQNLSLPFNASATNTADCAFSLSFPDGTPRGDFLISVVGYTGAINTNAIARSVTGTSLDVLIKDVYGPSPTLTSVSGALTEHADSLAVAGHANTCGYSLSFVMTLLPRSSSTTPFIVVPVNQFVLDVSYTINVSRIAQIALPLTSSPFDAPSFSKDPSTENDTVITTDNDTYGDLVKDMECLLKSSSADKVDASARAKLLRRLDLLDQASTYSATPKGGT